MLRSPCSRVGWGGDQGSGDCLQPWQTAKTGQWVPQVELLCPHSEPWWNTFLVQAYRITMTSEVKHHAPGHRARICWSQTTQSGLSALKTWVFLAVPLLLLASPLPKHLLRASHEADTILDIRCYQWTKGQCLNLWGMKAREGPRDQAKNFALSSCLRGTDRSQLL